jgi:hypothetical protein
MTLAREDSEVMELALLEGNLVNRKARRRRDDGQRE